MRLEFHVMTRPRPMARSRVRVVERGDRRFPVVYQPASNRAIVSEIRDAAQEAMKTTPVTMTRDTPILLFITFTFARPKTHFNAKGAVKNSAPRYCTQHADLDNLAKTVLDALHGCVYYDDAQVVSLTAKKQWGVHDDIHVIVMDAV